MEQLERKTTDGQTHLGYYGRPILLWPHWDVRIKAYLFLSGVAAGAFVVGALATLRKKDADDISRIAFCVAAAAGGASLPILVSHLGKPERFHHMLRVFKPASPMNAGAWALSAMAPIALLLALASVSDRFARMLPRKALAVAGTPPALFIGSYTGVLLSHTSVPLWAKSPLLSAVFACSAFATGTAAVTLSATASGAGSPAARRSLAKIENLAAIAETVALGAWLTQTGELSAPITRGALGNVFQYGVVTCGIALPLLLPSKKQRTSWLDVLKPLLVLVGGVLLRHVIVEGGRASSQDPQATFDYTRD